MMLLLHSWKYGFFRRTALVLTTNENCTKIRVMLLELRNCFFDSFLILFVAMNFTRTFLYYTYVVICSYPLWDRRYALYLYPQRANLSMKHTAGPSFERTGITHIAIYFKTVTVTSQFELVIGLKTVMETFL